MSQRKMENQMRRKWFTVGVAISLSAATFAKPLGDDLEQPWRAHGKEIKIDSRFGHNPAKFVKQSSETSKTPWTGAWWWTQSGSVAVRYHNALYWNENHTAKYWPTWEKSDAMTYDPFSAEELAGMSPEEIRTQLSPIEKLDVIAGHADKSKDDYYENLGKVRAWVKGAVEAHPEQLRYHGLCHGYSHAAIHLPEPGHETIDVDYTLASGKKATISVPFDSGDFKALATYFYGRRTKKATGHQAGFVGSNGGGMNPAALHLLLTNLVGAHDQSFVIDTGEGKPVWNYPVAGYSFSTNRSTGVTSSDADPRAVKQVFVSTDVTIMGTSNPTRTLWGDRNKDRLQTKPFSYYLELDTDNNVVGGSWASSSNRVDFAWSLKGEIPFEGDYELIAPYFRE